MLVRWMLALFFLGGWLVLVASGVGMVLFALGERIPDWMVGVVGVGVLMQAVGVCGVLGSMWLEDRE